MSGLLAVSAVLLALGMASMLLSGASAAQTVTIFADCDAGQVGIVGTSEGCDPPPAVKVLGFGDFDSGFICGRQILRGFLKFLLDAIPPGSHIIDARLSTRVVIAVPIENGTSVVAQAAVPIGVHRVTQSWDPDSGSFAWPGPTYGPTVDVKTVSLPFTWYKWDVADIVRDWMRGSPNHGVAFVAENEGTNQGMFVATPICEALGDTNFGDLGDVGPLQENEAMLEVTYEPMMQGVPEIPEASSLLLMGSGLAGFGGYALMRLRALRRGE
jgi:hypothetical protein